MGLTRSLLRELVWPAIKTADNYIRPKTIEAVRRSAWDRFATILRRPEVGADHLPGLEDLNNPIWKRIRDSVWQFNKELGELGFAGRYGRKLIEIDPTGASPKSTGVHELAHHIYSEVLSSKQQKSWRNAVKKYGVKTYDRNEVYLQGDVRDIGDFSAGMYGTDRIVAMLNPEDAASLNRLRSHPTFARSRLYRQQAVEAAGKPRSDWRSFDLHPSSELGEHYIANTESLAFTLQEILTPGQEITTPVGMLREIERIFDAPRLIERISHRLPVTPPTMRPPSGIRSFGPKPKGME